MSENNRIGDLLDRTLESIENWAKTPQFADPIMQQKAEILHTLSSLILVVALATITITPFVFNNPLYGVSITTGVILFSLLVQVLNRLGKTHLAAQLFVAVIWLFDSAMVFLSGGFYSDYLSSFITITIMGGLILGRMYAFHYAGISVGIYLVFFFLENQGYIPEPLIIFTPIALIIINIVNILLTAIVLVMVLIKYQENFDELVEKEISLSTINQKLNWEISARKEAESLLRESENRLKSALMESPYPTMLHTGNGEILLVNKAWNEKSGYTNQDMQTLDDWLNDFYRNQSPQVQENISQLVSGKENQLDGYFNLYTDRGDELSWYLRWTRLPDLPDGRHPILTIATDMTSTLNIEAALRKSEENYSKFTLVTNDGMWDWDLTTDEVDFDPRYYTMAGYEVDEFPHQLEEFSKRVHPDDVEKVFKEANAHLSGKIDRFNVEFRFLQKDGSWLWIMGRGKITEQDEYGNPLRFAGTHTDISSQKAIEEQLNQYQMHLEQTVKERTQSLNERISEVERLNAALTNILDDYQIANQKLTALSANLSSTFQELESFTYSMSNDLQEPVQSVKNSAERLIKNPPKGIKGKDLETLQHIHDNATLVDQRINDLLSISLLNRIDLNLVSVDVNALIEEVLALYSKDIKELNITIDNKDKPSCLADEELLSQVFNHLLGNAIKFTSKKDRPQIVIGSQPSESQNKIIYYVQDNGIGFEVEDQNKLFQTFEKLEGAEEYQGAGIGLTKAKIIINKHGGEIWAEAKKGSGATFFIELDSPRIEQD